MNDNTDQVPLAIQRLSEEEGKQLVALVQHHDTIIGMVKRKESFAIVGKYIKVLSGGAVVIVGALALGYEKFGMFINSVVGS